ncbi:MAG: prepilin peptidase [Desulfobulbaceae bacterium]|mgnify:CR=1 FL=1|nr:MAG: prepilin peptidase [Desulfobulbaceae bacterium]
MLHKDPYILAVVFVFGSMIGSFLNVVILRLPQPDASVVFPASHCPKCGATLRWFENIPIFSWFVLRGKCAHCSTSISSQYPIVELCTGLLAAANTVVFGLTPAAAGYFIFSAALVTIIWIDIHHQIIPDVISIPGIIIGFGFSFLSPLVTWQDSLYGLLAGGGIFFAISYSYYLIRKQEGLGGGDIKLLAMLGAFLGWQSLLFIILASSLTGSLFGLLAMVSQKKGGATRIPFGPFLAISGLAYLFFHQKIQYVLWLYTNLFR